MTVSPEVLNRKSTDRGYVIHRPVKPGVTHHSESRFVTPLVETVNETPYLEQSLGTGASQQVRVTVSVLLYSTALSFSWRWWYHVMDELLILKLSSWLAISCECLHLQEDVWQWNSDLDVRRFLKMDVFSCSASYWIVKALVYIGHLNDLQFMAFDKKWNLYNIYNIKAFVCGLWL